MLSLHQPHVFLDGHRALYIGPGLDLSPHKNAAATIAVALEHSFELSTQFQGLDAFVEHRAALIAPGTLHHLKSTGAMAFVYLDALSDDYEAIDPQSLAKLRTTIGVELLERLRQRTPETSPSKTIHAVLEHLEIPVVKPRLHRLTETIRAIDASPQDFARIEDAAHHAALSVSRFQHVFREEAGVPFRQYRLWRRMTRVALELTEGRSLTTAAYAAGFSSSAHLSSAFRNMFGLAPSTLLAAGTRFDIEVPAGRPSHPVWGPS